MADFKTPNLCGANPELNNALSKLDDLKNEISSKLDSTASEAAAAFETGLADVKAGLDGLAIDLPEIPPINFQSELTSVINDIDRTTVQGIAAFNAKLATLELDFGDTLKEKGLTLDSLITESTTKLSGGGNICDLVPNIDIPAGNSGTGVTTEEVEERGTGTSVTLTQIPKEIISVQGKKTGVSFFGNIQYTQNGKVIVPKETGTYSEIKVKYTVSLIKEKPVEAKQADTSPEPEEVSIVTTNVSAKDTSFAGLIAKFKKDVESAPSSKDVSKDIANIKSTFGFIGSPAFKAQQEKDFATWQTEYKKLKADPLNYKPVVTSKGETVKVTTPEVAITKEVKKDASGATYTETKRVTSSDAGMTTRPKEKFVELVRLDLAKEVLSNTDISKYQDTYETIQEVINYFTPATSAASIEIPDPVWNLIDVSLLAKGSFNPVTREISTDGIVEYTLTDFNNRGSELSTIYYQLNGQTITFNDIAGKPVDPFSKKDIFAINITYITLDKIDPNYRG